MSGSSSRESSSSTGRDVEDDEMEVAIMNEGGANLIRDLTQDILTVPSDLIRDLVGDLVGDLMSDLISDLISDLVFESFCFSFLF